MNKIAFVFIFASLLFLVGSYAAEETTLMRVLVKHTLDTYHLFAPYQVPLLSYEKIYGYKNPYGWERRYISCAQLKNLIHKKFPHIPITQLFLSTDEVFNLEKVQFLEENDVKELKISVGYKPDAIQLINQMAKEEVMNGARTIQIKEYLKNYKEQEIAV